MVSPDAVHALCQFATGKGRFTDLGVIALEHTYDWPLPRSVASLVGELEGSTNFARTLDLKEKLNVLWHNEPERRQDIAKWIVSDWGGVRANSSSTLEAHLRRAEGRNQSTPFAGVSSYSKIFSVVDPKQYAILDARVVVSLNAIQILADTKKGVAFPYISGRNNITGNQGKKRGFSTLNEYSVINLIQSRGWSRVARSSAYRIYSDLLHQCRERCSAVSGIAILEMALFSQAEELAMRVEPSLSN